MASSPEKCPDCEALNPFPLRYRPRSDGDSVIEVYIACTTCLWEQVLRLSTMEIEADRRLLAKLHGKSRQYEAKHGVVPMIIERQIRELKQRIAAGEQQCAS